MRYGAMSGFTKNQRRARSVEVPGLALPVQKRVEGAVAIIRVLLVKRGQSIAIIRIQPMQVAMLCKEIP